MCAYSKLHYFSYSSVFEYDVLYISILFDIHFMYMYLEACTGWSTYTYKILVCICHINPKRVFYLDLSMLSCSSYSGVFAYDLCTATHCDPLQHTATHCYTLPHTAFFYSSIFAYGFIHICLNGSIQCICVACIYTYIQDAYMYMYVYIYIHIYTYSYTYWYTCIPYKMLICHTHIYHTYICP